MAASVRRRLSPEDLRILALESKTVAGHTCKVILLSGRVDLDLLRSSIAGRLSRSPLLSVRLGEIDGAPSWVPDPHVDISAHVMVSDQVPDQVTALDEGGLRAAVAGIFCKHLDRSRPLWRIDVIPRLAGGGSALVWRIHHALADGSTAMRMAASVLWDEQPDIEPAAGTGEPRRRPGPATRPKRPESAAHRRFAGLRAAAREAPQPWMRSPFDGHIDGRRAVAFTSTGLADLHQAARAACGATVNDAVLTIVAGGLRRWLEARHGQLGPVRVKVPVSLHGLPHEPGDSASGRGNRDSFFCLDLPLTPADPLDRLGSIHHATRARKHDHDAQHLDSVMRELAGIPALSHFAERVLAHPRSFALNVSNVPGPRQRVRVLGIPVRAMYSLAEIGEHHALRIAVVSLAGTLHLGFVADPTLLADVSDLAADVQAEAAALITARPST
jgi:diacylglycerol O-acyltransferase / wax synthase